MRLLLVGIAGLIGWLWLASGGRDEPAPTAVARGRRADLTSLHAQVAVARATPDIALARDAARTDTGTRHDDTAVRDDTAARDIATRDGDLSDLAAQVAAAGELEPDELEPAELEPTDEPAELEEVLLAADVVGHEVIRIVDHAPMIDPGSVSHCGTVEDEYTVNIPMIRPFEGVLVEETDATPEGSFSSGTPIENEYIVEDD